LPFNICRATGGSNLKEGFSLPFLVCLFEQEEQHHKTRKMWYVFCFIWFAGGILVKGCSCGTHTHIHTPNLTVDNDRDENHKVPGGIKKVDGQLLLHFVCEESINSLLDKGGRRKFQKGGYSDRGYQGFSGKKTFHSPSSIAVSCLLETVVGKNLIVDLFR
jgi:hypothetical protein